MNTSARGIVIGLALTVGCVAGGWARDGGRPSRAGESEASTPLRDYALPYHGYGEVAVLNDGMLVVDMGGKVAFDGDGWMTVSPVKTIVYWLDSSEVKLVESDNMVFLDKGGAEMTRRGVSPLRATVTAFDRHQDIKAGAQRYSLADFAGDLEVSFDDKTRRLTVKITDSQEEEKAMTFTLAGRVTPRAAALGGGEAGALATAAGGDDEILLLDGEDPPWLSTTCSADCRLGSCEASCAGTAHCYCTREGHPRCWCDDIH